MTREAQEIMIAARVQELKMYGRLASAIYEVVETEVLKQLRERQLAANPRKDDRCAVRWRDRLGGLTRVFVASTPRPRHRS